MPINFKNPPHYTEVADKPTRKTGYGTIANETTEAGQNLSSAIQILSAMPHYGIKAVKPKKSV